jgi:hypothetical protein
VDDAEMVGDHEVFRSGRDQQLQDRRSSRARPRLDDPHVAEILPDDAQGIGERGEYHDRRAVLVVVEDRDVEQFAEPPFDLEAARRRDVLEVDTGETGSDELDRPDDLVDILGIQADGPGIDTCEPFEECRLAFHDGKRGSRPQIAESKDGGTISHHRNRIALDGQPPGVRRICRDRLADTRYAWCVDHRQVIPIADRHL